MAVLDEDGSDQSGSSLQDSHTLARVKLALKYEQKRVSALILSIFQQYSTCIIYCNASYKALNKVWLFCLSCLVAISIFFFVFRMVIVYYNITVPRSYAFTFFT